MIQFTISEAWTVILAICGGIVTISAAVGVALKIIHHFKKPNLRQDERLDALEERVERMENENKSMHNEFMVFFKNDKERLDSIEAGNRVTQHALLALLSHGIDGNDIESLKKAKHDLEQYLIAR